MDKERAASADVLEYRVARMYDNEECYPQDIVSLVLEYQGSPAVNVTTRGGSTMSWSSSSYHIQSQGISKDEIYRQINSIVSDALMYQFQETTGRSGEFIYIPSDLTTFKQVNPIAGPTVISFIDGWDFKSGHAISAFSVGGAQLETARMVAGYEGINSDGTTTKLYAYADLLPEGTHIIDMFTSVEEAAKNGYYYDPVYMG